MVPPISTPPDTDPNKSGTSNQLGDSNKPTAGISTGPMRMVDTATDLLDTKFHIPGTNIRFGADFLMGLIPGVGDAVSLTISGLLIATMARHGASGRLVARMLANVGLDALVGTIPVAGNAFDLVYKANSKNLKLMREFYDEDKHRGSAWPIVLAVVLFLSFLFAAIVLIGYFIVRGVMSLFASS